MNLFRGQLNGSRVERGPEIALMLAPGSSQTLSKYLCFASPVEAELEMNEAVVVQKKGMLRLIP